MNRLMSLGNWWGRNHEEEKKIIVKKNMWRINYLNKK